ncbi:internal virion protein B [Caudoviricetes sp.]|nr:internal virion protein B [Caudoviricetes sp.]
MCWVAAIPLAMAAVSGLMNMKGQQQQTEATQQAAQYNAQIADNNAVIAERNVRQAQLEVGREIQQQQMKTSQLIGTQRALYGASGLDINFGTPLAVQQSSQMMGNQEVLALQDKSKAKERAFRQQGADFTNQANMYRMSSVNAGKAGQISAVSGLLGTASNVAGTGQTFGVWGK